MYDEYLCITNICFNSCKVRLIDPLQKPIVPYFLIWSLILSCIYVFFSCFFAIIMFLQDSAEQNMFSFAANMYLTLYMRLINQRNRTLERDAFYHMNILYQRQMSFMKPDGSFSLFRSDWYEIVDMT